MVAKYILFWCRKKKPVLTILFRNFTLKTCIFYGYRHNPGSYCKELILHSEIGKS